MRSAALLALSLSLLSAAALADIYRSVDADGHVQYSDTPTPGAQLVRVSNLRASSIPLPSSNASTVSNAAGSDAIHDKLVDEAAARSVKQDVAQTRADQCKKATDDYQHLIQSRRVYKTGKDGEREYLTDADADQMRLNVRIQMDAACKG